MSVVAMILAGGEGPALSVLTALRSEAAVPFAGKYRIIDFALSNCVNSGVNDVNVLTQYQPLSLNEHIGLGRPWDLDRTSGGIRLLQPYQSTRGERGAWQAGTADALRSNLNVLRPAAENVLILAGDHVYKMDYRPMVRFHEEHRAGLTLAVRPTPSFEAHRFGMVSASPDGRVVEFVEKPRRTRSTQASMGIYVVRRELLVNWLTGPGKKQHDLGREVIPALVQDAAVYAYPFQGYWADIGTIQAYYEANMALREETPALELHDPEWPIYTRSEERPAVMIGEKARVGANLLCDGCRIEGDVTRSVISPGVYVAPGAVVRDSIIMTDTIIERGAVVDRAILDKRVHVGEAARVGRGDDLTPNRRWPERLNTGLTLAGKGAAIPAQATVGRNVVIFPRAEARDYPAEEIASGETIGA